MKNKDWNDLIHFPKIVHPSHRIVLLHMVMATMVQMVFSCMDAVPRSGWYCQCCGVYSYCYQPGSSKSTDEHEFMCRYRFFSGTHIKLTWLSLVLLKHLSICTTANLDIVHSIYKYG